MHCTEGPGRTLAALYLMQTHGFRAWEAMGWLRIALPGPASGEQQRCLCAAERRQAVLAAVRLAQAGRRPRGFRSAFLPKAGLRGKGAAAVD